MVLPIGLILRRDLALGDDPFDLASGTREEFGEDLARPSIRQIGQKVG